MANQELDIWAVPKYEGRIQDQSIGLVLAKDPNKWTFLQASSKRSVSPVATSPERGIKVLNDKKKKGGYIALLVDAPVRGDVHGSVNLLKPEHAKCIALMLEGRRLSEHAILNYVAPMLKLLARASDAVSLLNQLQDYGGQPADIQDLRKAIQDVGWEEIDGPSSAYLNPPQPCLGPWSW